MFAAASADLETRITERAPALAEIAEELLRSGVLPADRVLYFPARIPLMARAYFILNECYRQWRIMPGHWTEFPKIAAIQCMAIMTVPPFRPIDPRDVQSIPEARCNEIFALACGTAAIKTKIDSEKSNFYLRMLDVIAPCRSETLEPFVVDVEFKIQRPFTDYVRGVHEKDEFPLNSLITIFELISGEYG